MNVREMHVTYKLLPVKQERLHNSFADAGQLAPAECIGDPLSESFFS